MRVYPRNFLFLSLSLSLFLLIDTLSNLSPGGKNDGLDATLKEVANNVSVHDAEPTCRSMSSFTSAVRMRQVNREMRGRGEGAGEKRINPYAS